MSEKQNSFIIRIYGTKMNKEAISSTLNEYIKNGGKRDLLPDYSHIIAKQYGVTLELKDNQIIFKDKAHYFLGGK